MHIGQEVWLSGSSGKRKRKGLEIPELARDKGGGGDYDVLFSFRKRGAALFGKTAEAMALRLAFRDGRLRCVLCSDLS